MPRYMVELAYRYLMCKNFMIKVGIPIEIKRRERHHEKKSIKFIDVIGYDGSKLIVIETRSFRGVKKIKQSLRKLCSFFQYVDKVKSTLIGPNAKVDSVEYLLIVEEEDLDRIKEGMELLNKCGVKVLSVESIVKDLVSCAFREEEVRKDRGEGDLILAVIRAIARYYEHYGQSHSS